MLNTIEYVSINLKNSAEYTRILNVPDAVHSIRCLYKLLFSHRDMYSEQCQTFKMECFAKRIIPNVTKKNLVTFRQNHKKKRPRRETFWNFFS